MRKLKIALTLLFAMSVSLFLFACAGGEGGGEQGKDGIKSVVVEAGKSAKTYTDSDTASSWTTDGLTVKVNYVDANKESAVIPANECTWDLTAVKWGTVNSTTGYEVKVTPNGQPDGAAVSGTYRVKINHDWGTASAEGTTECGYCHAQMTERDITDVLRYKAFHDGPYSGEGDKYSDLTTALGESGGKIMDGVLTVTYGTIGIGQTLTLTGHAEAFRAEYMDKPGSDEASSHWFFPIMGVSIGNNSLLVRNDGWVLYDGIGGANVTADARKLQGFFQTGADGSNGKFDNEIIGDIVEENWNNGVTIPEDAMDWFPYMDGELCRTSDYEDGGADIALTWNFRTDNIMEITFNNIDAGKLMTMRFKVPTQTYNIILHGEQVVMKLDHLSSISTLTNPVYRVEEVTKTDYAEGEMFDVSTVKAFANYDQANNVPVTAAVYATLGTEEKVDLSSTPLAAGMTNFRAEFGSQVIYLTSDRTENGTPLVNVVPSVFTGADGKAALEYNNVVFIGEKAQYAYGAADGKIAISVTGTANSLTAEQKTALGTAKDFYISLALVSRLTGEDFNKIFENFNESDLVVKLGDDAFTGLAISGEGTFGAIIPVDSSMLDKKITFSFNGIDAQADIVLDLSALEIPAASSVVSGTATIAGGGDITVVYKGEALKADLDSNIRIYVGNSQLIGENIVSGAEIGAFTLKAVTHDKTAGTLTLVYTLPAVDIENASLSYGIALRIGSEYVRDTVHYAAQIGTAATDAKGTVIATDGSGSVYAQAAGDKLYLLLPYAEAGTADLNRTVKLNINAGEATISAEKSANAKVYDLSYSLTRAGVISFINGSNALAEASKITYAAIGTDGVNRGAYVLITVDVTAAEVRSEDAAQEYYFELNPVDVVEGTALTIYKVGAKIEAVEVTPAAADKVNIVSGDCTEGSVQGIAAYAYKGEGETVLFYYGIKVTAAGHDWTGTDVQTCSKCHAVKKDGNASNITVAKLNEEIKTNGFSISFLATDKKNNDWDTKFITVDHIEVSLMNFGDWEELDKHNIYSGFDASVLQNGAGYGQFLSTTSYATVVFDPDATNGGVRYYQNGKLVANYTNDIVMQYNNSGAVNPDEGSQKKVSDFVTHILNKISSKSFTFASQPTATDMYIQTSALNDNGAKAQYDLYVSEHGEIVVPKEDPVYSNRQTMSAAQPVTFGGAYDPNPAWLTRIDKGDKLEFEGTITPSGNASYQSVLLLLWSGSAPKGNFRSDNFVNDEANLTAFEHWAIGKNATGDIVEAKTGGASVKVTYDWSGSNVNQIVITLVITNTADSTKVYTQTYTVTPDEDHIKLDEDHYAVGFSKDACSVSLTKFVKNGSEQTPDHTHKFVGDTCSCGATITTQSDTYTNDTIGNWGAARKCDFDLYEGQTITLEATYADGGADRWNGFIVQLREDGSNDNLYFIRPAGDYAYGAYMAWGGNNAQMTAPGFIADGDAPAYTALKKTAKTEITVAYADNTVTVTYKTYNAAGTEVEKTQVWTATGMTNGLYTVNFALDGATANGNITVSHQVVTEANAD